MMERRCDGCRFWTRDERIRSKDFDSIGGLGACRRRSPVFERGQSTFPIVAGEEFCGDWKRKPERLEFVVASPAVPSQKDLALVRELCDRVLPGCSVVVRSVAGEGV